MAKKNSDYMLTLHVEKSGGYNIGEAFMTDDGHVKLKLWNWSVVFDGTSVLLVPNKKSIAKELRKASKHDGKRKSRERKVA
jgi:hypothetical protein